MEITKAEFIEISELISNQVSKNEKLQDMGLDLDGFLINYTELTGMLLNKIHPDLYEFILSNIFIVINDSEHIINWEQCYDDFINIVMV